MKKNLLAILCIFIFSISPLVSFSAEKESVPIIYTTDLYHPHQDPDDHFDLATLFAIPEFDIRAIVIDRGEGGANRPGVCAIQQMNFLTGKNIPYALGLIENLKSPKDRAENHPKDAQAGVEIILKALRESSRPVTFFTTGSLRDTAAAYNREPDLFKEKVERLYINAGHSSGGKEWNVDLDRHAFFRMLSADLPIYWMPCFGDNGYLTHWRFPQRQVLDPLPVALQNFFLFAFTKTDPNTANPIQALKFDHAADIKESFWKKQRNMWCTAGFLHAAGHPDETFSFIKKQVVLDEANGNTTLADKGNAELLTFFQIDKDKYTRSMTETLSALLSGMLEK